MKRELYIKSPIHAHEQNGLIERKYRHMFQTRLTMIVHVNVPLKLWVEFSKQLCTLSTSYHQFLYKMVLLFFFFRLYKRHPDYSYLCVFRYKSFPYLRNYGDRKFSEKTYPSVFLRYSFHHKGYVCYHPNIYIKKKKDIYFKIFSF